MKDTTTKTVSKAPTTTPELHPEAVLGMVHLWVTLAAYSADHIFKVLKDTKPFRTREIEPRLTQARQYIILSKTRIKDSKIAEQNLSSKQMADLQVYIEYMKTLPKVLEARFEEVLEKGLAKKLVTFLW